MTAQPLASEPAGARHLPISMVPDRQSAPGTGSTGFYHLVYAELPFQDWLCTQLVAALCVPPRPGSLSFATITSAIRWPELIAEHPEQLWAPHNPSTDPPGLTWDVIASIWGHLVDADICPWMRVELYWMGGHCAAIRPLILGVGPGPVQPSAVRHMLDTVDRARGLEPGPELSDEDLQLGWQVVLWP